MAVKAVGSAKWGIGIGLSVKELHAVLLFRGEAFKAAGKAVKLARAAHDAQHKLLSCQAEFFSRDGLDPECLPEEVAVGGASIEL